ncbi:MAG: zinc ribbon domain-containing protein, partial [Abitibacteriaceae bacterium]|nr:zinc ribbon domain-containing protein [Abditibacteriaceae bacterium]
QRRGKHEPMITVFEFNRLQEIVRRKTHSRRRQCHFTYTGIIRCGYCGLQITAEQHYKSGMNRIYYHCSDTYLKCCKKGINEAELEQKFLEQLNNITVDPVLCEITFNNIARWQGQQSQTVDAILNQQQQALESIKSQRKNLLDLMVKGLLSDEATFREKEEELIQEQNRLQFELAHTTEQVAQVTSRARAGLDYLQRARDNFLVASPQRKKEIVCALGLSYSLKGKELSITMDPLLSEMVKFIDQIMAKLEPAFAASPICYRANFSQKSYVGRDTRSLIEIDPPESLAIALGVGFS